MLVLRVCATKCEPSRVFVKQTVLPSTIETASIKFKFNDNVASQMTAAIFLTVVQKMLSEITLDVTGQFVERMAQLDKITQWNLIGSVWVVSDEVKIVGP